jgi:hypothetical protein
MLDVIDKRARLERSLRSLPGPLADPFSANLTLRVFFVIFVSPRPPR